MNLKWSRFVSVDGRHRVFVYALNYRLHIDGRNCRLKVCSKTDKPHEYDGWDVFLNFYDTDIEDRLIRHFPNDKLEEATKFAESLYFLLDEGV